MLGSEEGEEIKDDDSMRDGATELMNTAEASMESADPLHEKQMRESSETALLVKAIMGEWQSILDSKS